MTLPRGKTIGHVLQWVWGFSSLGTVVPTRLFFQGLKMGVRFPGAIFALLMAMLPGFAAAASVTGVLVSGGGIDDMSLTIKSRKGEEIYVFCTTRCGDWFGPRDNDDVVSLRKGLAGRKVKVTYAEEENRDRIAGPSSDERLNFLKKLEWLPD